MGRDRLRRDRRRPRAVGVLAVGVAEAAPRDGALGSRLVGVRPRARALLLRHGPLRLASLAGGGRVRGREQETAIFEALAFEIPTAALCYWIAYRTERFLALVVEQALHVAAAREGATQSDLVGVLEVAADGEAAGEPRHPDAPA